MLFLKIRIFHPDRHSALCSKFGRYCSLVGSKLRLTSKSMREASQAISLILYRCLDDPGVYSTDLIGLRRGLAERPELLLLHLAPLACCAGIPLDATGNRPSTFKASALQPSPSCAPLEDTEKGRLRQEAHITAAVDADGSRERPPQATLRPLEIAVRTTPVRRATAVRTFMPPCGVESTRFATATTTPRGAVTERTRAKIKSLFWEGGRGPSAVCPSSLCVRPLSRGARAPSL